MPQLDQSLSVLAGWLQRRGSRTAGAGMLLNTDCAERAAGVYRVLARIIDEEGDRWSG